MKHYNFWLIYVFFIMQLCASFVFTYFCGEVALSSHDKPLLFSIGAYASCGMFIVTTIGLIFAVWLSSVIIIEEYKREKKAKIAKRIKNEREIF